ncbi:MAG: DUF3991 and toprim domain-containing protein [Oscillospiraceae bacterium]|jgi:hypothetical protein|nr:DUF3991 and toprim domain-containing protein [Oscillospiraceae bacterium]
MKETPQFEPIPHEQILQARQADIAVYLARREEQLIPTGGSFRLTAHDSLFITGNKFMWNSRQESGNAVDFLRLYYGMGFREAVEELTASGVEKKAALPTTAPETFDFAKIELAPDMQRVIDYLNYQRGISPELITGLIKNRQLFQEAKTNNAIFPIYEGKEIVGAELVGTAPNIRFKGIKSGGKFGCGYNLAYGDKKVYTLFFESAIDLLSFIELSRMNGKSLEDCHLTSLMGLKENIFNYTMAKFPDTQAFLCVDNDEAGANFIKKLQESNIDVGVRSPDAAYKDWNDMLRAVRGQVES